MRMPLGYKLSADGLYRRTIHFGRFRSNGKRAAKVLVRKPDGTLLRTEKPPTAKKP